jgi:hypothetical protein
MEQLTENNIAQLKKMCKKAKKAFSFRVNEYGYTLKINKYDQMPEGKDKINFNTIKGI